MTGTSRMLYALARDQAVPASNVLKQVNGNHLPGHAVWAVAALTSCLVIAPFPLSESIFEIIISATTITIHFAYGAVPFIFVLFCGSITKSAFFQPSSWDVV